MHIIIWKDNLQEKFEFPHEEYMQRIQDEMPIITKKGKATSKNEAEEKEVTVEVLKEHVEQVFCPHFYKLIQAAIVIPVSSAGCGRSFPTLRRIKTCLRSIMGQERF